MRLDSHHVCAKSETLVSLFAKTAARYRGRVAVLFEGSPWTYGELDESSNELSKVLVTAGIGPGDLVGVWLPRSPQAYVAILGVLKAGAGYVPFDEDAPSERVVGGLSDCSAVALISVTKLVFALRDSLPGCVLLGETESSVASPVVASAFCTDATALLIDSADIEREGWPHRPVRSGEALCPEDTAYVIYTSGSTGRPKGVVLSHANVLAFVAAESEIFDVTTNDRVWQGFSLSFDASVEELWLAWRTGAALVCATKDELRSGPDLPEVMHTYGVTVLSCVPTLLGMFDGDLPGVRLLILGGEACADEVARRWCQPGRRVVNTYGPTETTVVSTWADLDPNRPVRIGVALPGYRTWVVDTQLELVANGASGELVVGGPAVAQGYLGRAELTAEKFIRPTWAAGERAYRTGDLVRVDSEGSLEFLGRIDDQVKLRGHRIELGEVDASLLELPGVRGATSTVHRRDGGDVLVGYVRLRPECTFDEIAARRQLGSRLTSAMVPGRFVVVDEFPRLTSGKIDRKSLPAPQENPLVGPFGNDAAVSDQATGSRFDSKNPNKNDVMFDSQVGDLTEWSEVELALRSLYRLVLPGLPIARGTNFFQVGGDSLRATELVSQLRADNRFPSVSVRDLYQNPVLEQLAAHLAVRFDPDFCTTRRSAPGEAIDGSGAPIRSFNPRERARQKPGEPGQHDCQALHDPMSNRVNDSRLNNSELDGRPSVSTLRYRICGVIQTFALYPLLAIMSPPWLITFVAFYGISEPQSQHRISVATLFGVLVVLASAPVRMALCIITKWVVLGRVRPGRYRLWGSYHLRFWFVNRTQDILRFDQLRSTPLMNRYLKLMGATIGEGAHIATGDIRVPDLLTIGADATVDHDAMLLSYQIADGWLFIGRITIGAGARVGVRAAMAYDSDLGDGAELGDGAMLPTGGSVPSAEHWSGSPAKPDGGLSDSWPKEMATTKEPSRLAFSIGFAALSLIPVIASIPEAFLFGYIDQFCDFTKGYGDFWKLAAVTPLAAATFILTLSLLIAFTKRLVLPNVEPGIYPVHSRWYVRKWFSDSLLHLSLDLLFPMYASLYLPPWLRLMGARLGKDVELSTAANLNPDLLDLAQGVFVADNVSLGASRTHRGWVHLDRVRVGRNSFIGNNAVVPAGTELGNDVLVGVQSMPPSANACSKRDDTSWLGIPAIELPNRSRVTDFAQALTYQPTRQRKALRAFIEFWRIVTPLTFVAMGSLLLLLVAEDIADRTGLRIALLIFPLLLGVLGFLLAVLVIMAKWILVGRYRAQERPLWDHFVWRSEFVNALHENVAMGVGVRLAIGTPLLPVYLRAMGAHIGRRTCLESAYLTEFDLVHLGDEVAFNESTDAQTHLFEDRVMKMSTVHVHQGASIGARSVVLYDAVVKEGARLDAQSLVMKGEQIPAHTHWHGSPAEPVESIRAPVAAVFKSGC